MSEDSKGCCLMCNVQLTDENHIEADFGIKNPEHQFKSHVHYGWCHDCGLLHFAAYELAYRDLVGEKKSLEAA